MIIRIFSAKVQPGKQSEYESLLKDEAIPGLSEQHGLISLHVGVPIPETPDEFVIITFWQDLESLQAFAGESWLKSFVLPGEEHLVMQSEVHCYNSLPQQST